MELFTERHAAKITGVLSCLDRVVISGTIPGICYAEGMSGYLRFKGIRIFDYARWAEPLRDQIRQNAQHLAEKAGVDIEHLRSSNLRKESLVREILKKRGEHQGLVCIFSAMEGCPSYKPWHDKPSGRTFLKGDTGKCLHTTTFILSTRSSGSAICGCRPGPLFGCSFILTGTGRLRPRCANDNSRPGCSITPLSMWRIGFKLKVWQSN